MTWKVPLSKTWKPNPDLISFRIGVDELPAGAVKRARDFAIKVDEHHWNVEQGAEGTRWHIYTDLDDKPLLAAIYVDEGPAAPDEEGARARYTAMLAGVGRSTVYKYLNEIENGNLENGQEKRTKRRTGKLNGHASESEILQ